MNDKEIIKDFLNNIANQDNRSTAAPYFYVIRSSVEVPAHEGCGDIVKYYDPEDPEDHYESIEDYIELQKEYSEYDDMIPEDKEFFDKKMENAERNLASYEVSLDWRESNMFLTETDAKNHLKSNSHHYSEDAHTYVKHCWRAYEMDDFYVALFNYFGISRGNLDLKGINLDEKL